MRSYGTKDEQRERRGSRERGDLTPFVILVFGGAALAALGALLPWAKVTAGTFTGSPKGIDGWEGKTVLVLAIGMVIRGALAARGRRVMAAFVGIGGLVIAGIAGYTLLMLRHELIDVAAKTLQSQIGTTLDQAKLAMERALQTGLVAVSPQIGIFMSVLGGLMGAAGGLVAALQRPAEMWTPTATSAPVSGGWSSAEGPWQSGPVVPPAMPAPPAALSEGSSSVPWQTISVPSRTRPARPVEATPPAPEAFQEPERPPQ